MILKELAKRGDDIFFETPTQPCSNLLAYQNVHSERLVKFLSTAWDRWDALGTAGQDPSSSTSPLSIGEKETEGISPPLIPGSSALPRDPYQCPSQNVMGQIGFFCMDTLDTCTPVIALLKEELLWDGAVVQQAVASIQNHKVVYALATHPGHHAAKDSFGGYCYLNHAAFATHLLQNSGYLKVAVLDIDYVRRRKAKLTCHFDGCFYFVSSTNIFLLSAMMIFIFSTVEMGLHPFFMRILRYS